MYYVGLQHLSTGLSNYSINHKYREGLGKGELSQMDHRPNILIAEDEKSQRSPDSKELKEESHDSDRGRNGKEAIQILNTLKPDLIVLDIVMPVMKSMVAGIYRDRIKS